MSVAKKTVMVVDDHPIIHEGLKTLLTSEKDLNICLSARSAAEAIEILNNASPDIVIIDLSLGDSDGSYLVQRLRKQHPKLRILIYTMSDEKLFAERTATAGADGFVMKTSPPSELKKAIRTVLAGKNYFPSDMKKGNHGNGKDPQALINTLSNREMDIFKLVGEGLDTITIGSRLNISRNTVDTHRINIKNKLELPNGKALDRFAFEMIQSKQPE